VSLSASCKKLLSPLRTYYIENTCADGIPMWDTGAPNLHRLGNYLNKPADPFNKWEPVDSSAAVIAAQGLIRLGNYLRTTRHLPPATRYFQAGLTVANTLFNEPYLSTNPKHQGLILHSVYHRPNGWDYVAPGRKCRTAKARCGAIITPASWRCCFCARPKEKSI